MIVVGGENLIDLVAQAGEHTALPEYSTSYTAIPGGSPYNCALAIARQGGQVTYATPISNDNFGELLAAKLKRSNVVLGVECCALPTSLAIVFVSQGIANYQFYRQGTADRAVTRELIAKACPPDMTIFHIGSIALIDGEDSQVWQEHFTSCYKQNIITSFDPNVRPVLVTEPTAYRKRILYILEKTDILKLSDEDLGFIIPHLSSDASFDELFQRTTAKVIILTKGKEGALVQTGNNRFHVPAFSASPLVDTVGAGDTFMGTILCELQRQGFDSRDKLTALKSVNLRKIVERANRAAAINCQQKGCEPPYLEQLADN